MVDNVINILQQQQTIYQKLIKYSRQMQKAIVKDDTTEMNILIQAESALAMKFSVLEKKRTTLVNNIAKTVGYGGNNFNIDELKKHSTAMQIQKLNTLESDIADIIVELNELNTTNGSLIKNRLDVVNFSLNYLGLATNAVYNKTNLNNSSQSKLIDESI
ncbi:flagellar protein FlgN [Clostridium sp. 'deep sea']|uniref:flagellar protein FlgN n=1 Tax=Clostridium sp. 'deep sea' TaxID=2779445 RepID=UPI0018969082|nr:flagellar protein FlgN [Clostridium sp. 'deep sea']QOR35362.1 flagellar protein FlgN [Clostridium sp. 'deep sea']